jgi:endo-1,4-beta-D-glucanase Y
VNAIAIKGYVPEKIDALTGEILNNTYSPFGFSAAVAPYFWPLGKRNRTSSNQSCKLYDSEKSITEILALIRPDIMIIP